MKAVVIFLCHYLEPAWLPWKREECVNDVDEYVLPHLGVLVVEVLHDEVEDLHWTAAHHQVSHHLLEEEVIR